MSELIYVWFTDATETVIQGSAAGPQPEESWEFQGAVQTDDPRYVAFINFSNPGQGQFKRAERDALLRENYDRGITMALRALRMAVTPEQTDYAQGKIAELDQYAELLTAIPEQPGFPVTITWPVLPTK